MTLRVTRKGMTAGHTAAYDRTGLALAMGSHLVWGSMPLYLILVKAVPAVEFVAWRLIFTLPLCVAIIAWRRGTAELRTVVADRKALATLAGSAAMIAINWLLYVWAIQTDHVYAASLGYYILPLVMMVLGVVFLREQLSILQRGCAGGGRSHHAVAVDLHGSDIRLLRPAPEDGRSRIDHRAHY